MSEDLQVRDGVRVATNGAGPHPGDMGDTPQPESVYEVLERLPEMLTGQIVDGVLYASPKPATPHVRSASRLGAILSPFDLGTEGLGGWVILDEPELRVGLAPEAGTALGRMSPRSVPARLGIVSRP